MALLSSAFGYGPAASRPTDNTALTAGRIYATDDTGRIYRDNGTGWDELFSAGDVVTVNGRSGIVVLTAADVISGTAGRVPFIAGSGAGLNTDAGLAWDNTTKTLTASTPGADPALDGHATGTAGWGVHGYGGGATGRGVVGEVGDGSGVPFEGRAPSGQTADLLDLLVNGATKFAIDPAGTITTGGVSGGAGRVPFVAGASGGLASAAGLTWDAANEELTATCTQPGRIAVQGTAPDNGTGVYGEANGSGLVFGVYGFAGTGGNGVEAEAVSGIALHATADDPAGRPIRADALTGQTADLLQLAVNNVVLFAVAPSGRPRFVSTPPSSATDTGTAGEYTWDAGYYYQCIATNMWVRAALSTW